MPHVSPSERTDTLGRVSIANVRVYWLELPRYDGHLSLWANQGGESWREAEGGIRPSTRSRLSSL